MNVLFVNYGDFTTNSLNHLAPFAAGLAAAGDSVVVAVPGGLETVACVPSPAFLPATHAEVVANVALFPDGRPADVVHAWTPRESVRRTVLSYLDGAADRPALVVHLEDNEELLVEAYTGGTWPDWVAAPPDVLAARLADGLSHPWRWRSFLAAADVVTVITPRLAELVPAPVPVALLRPGLPAEAFAGEAAAREAREGLGISAAERVVVYCGSATFANHRELAALYRAVRRLNEDGLAVRLVRTGFDIPLFNDLLEPGDRAAETALGFVEKGRLPGLMAMADVLVQPGRPGQFNDYRLPSKVPEFLASGRPVVMPLSNIGLEVEEGVEALVLREGTAEETAAVVARVLTDPVLAVRLGAAGRRFARREFDLGGQVARLRQVHARALSRPAPGPGPAVVVMEGQAERRDWARRVARDAARQAEDLAWWGARVDEVEGARRAVVAAARDEALRQEAARLAVEAARAEAEEAHLVMARARDAAAAATAELQDTLAAAAERERDLRGRIETLERTLGAATARGDRWEDKVRRMEASLSWRLTVPLRWLRRRLESGRGG